MAQASKILIIEDDTYTRDVYKEILEGEGFEISVAVDGQEGLAKISEGGFDLVLLDVMMPKMDGLELLEALQKNPPKQKNGPILLLTNLGHDQVIKKALATGAQTYLVKSDINPDDLVKNVKKFLGL